jgi:phage-related protein
MHLFKYDARMQPILSVRFYRTTSGKEPVRDWLIEQVSLGARKAIGADIKTVQFGWPIGMPVVRKIEPGLWEVRSNIPEGISRLLFTVSGSDLVLLHGFIKKTQAIPKADLALAETRMKEVNA